MSNTIFSQSGKVEYGVKEYYVDTDAEKETLPIRSAKMGSKCYVIEDKKWYVLNGSFEWVPFVDKGGSGGSPFNIKGSVAEISDLPQEDNEIGDVYIVEEDNTEYVWVTNETYPDGHWEKIGEEINAESIISATSNMSSQQTTQLRDNIKAAPELFIVTFTKSNNVWSASANYPNIYAAYSTGKTILFKYKTSAAIADYVTSTPDNNFRADLIILENDDVKEYTLQSVAGYGASGSVKTLAEDGAQVTSAAVASAIGDMTAQQAATALEDLGGEPEKFIVSISYDGLGVYTADKTFAEIKAAYIAGKTIVVKYDDMEYTLQTLTYEGSSYGEAYFVTYSFSNFNHSGRMRQISVMLDGGNDYWRYDEIYLEEKSEVYEDNSSTMTITPEENYIYDCKAAALTSLTITNPPATGSYVIKFNSGSTPTTTTIPATIHGLESFAAEANTHYEINVEDNYAVVGKWAIS